MLSHLHATLTEMFRHRPALAAEMLSDVLGMTVPAHRQARLGSSEVVALRATEHRADAVVLLGSGQDGDDAAVCAVVVEIQLRAEEEKRWTWPLYVASVRRRWRCPTMLLVLCTDAVTAQWAGTPIPLGNDASRLVPAVVGPQVVPVMTDVAEAARAPELTVLSALAHAEEDRPLSSLDVLAGALATIDVELAVEYASLVLAALPERARAHLEELMVAQPYIYESDFTERLRAEGRTEGRVEGRVEGSIAILLRVLDRRGIEVPDHAHARITACSDLAQVEAWTDRALSATSVEELFAQA